MNLPHSESLPIKKLAASFSNTSATYKFYWLLGIVELVEEGKTNFTKREIFARMIGSAWYTVHYFHLSFGKQDLIQLAAQTIMEGEGLTIDIRKETLLPVLENSPLRSTINALSYFNKNVPHWFLSPWFPKLGGENDTSYRKRIYSQSQHFENECPYGLYEEHITINPKWTSYMQQNARILKDFIYWNLTLFLQVRNPNIPDIANKLIRPPFRGSLTNQRKNYWDIVFQELGTVDCIFTNSSLTADKYALDHFVPHAFVSHDLIWNLVPIDKSFNSIKSDKLPLLETHFDGFFKLQQAAFEIVNHHNPKNKLLEEYVLLFPDLSSGDGFDYVRFKENIAPLITIAHNNGFGYLNL